jgi:hypothetical protein
MFDRIEFDCIAHTLAALARAFFRIEMFLLLGCQRNRRGSYHGADNFAAPRLARNERWMN